MNYKARDPERQQVPGNGRFFDSRLLADYAKNKSNTLRTVGTLSYLIEKQDSESGLISKRQLKEEIWDYLSHEMGLEENKTCKVHMINNLLAVGFAEEVIGSDRQINYKPAFIGELFLNNYLDDKERKNMEILVDQLYRFTYPNPGTTKVSEKVKSFPFRILFYFILKEGYVTGKFMLFQFPYLINSGCLDFNPTLKSELCKCGAYYHKWWQWVIPMLVKVGILKLEESDCRDTDFDRLYNTVPNKKWAKGTCKKHYGTKIVLSQEYKDIIKHRYGNLSVLDLFHNDDVYSTGVRLGKKIRKDSGYAEKVKERDNYMCRLTGKQSWWKSGINNKPGCAGHHIIPMEYQERILEETGIDIDHEDYMITVLIDIHECIHKGRDKDRMELLLQAYECLSAEAKAKIILTKEKYLNYYGIKNYLSNS